VLAARTTGDYSAYSAAYILFQLPHAIFAVSIFTALLPAMASRWADDDVAGFRRHLSQGIRTTGAIVIPAALGYVVLARPIVRLLLEHGVAGAESGELVADLLAVFALGLFPFSAYQMLLRAHYAMHDSRTPALVTAAAVALNVVADLVLFFGLDLGVQGLALGHAGSYAFATVVLLYLIRRRLGRVDGARIGASLGRTLLASAGSAGAAWLVARGIGDAVGVATLGGQTVQVLSAVAAGVVVFVIGAVLLRIEEVDMVRRQLAGRFRR
jgi:putative peptidoglycan lipid II flippase